MGIDIEEVTEFLGQVPLLQRLPGSSLRKIAEVVKLKHYNPNEYVVRDGEIGEGVYFVWDGEAAVNGAHNAEENRSKQIRLKRYDYFGYCTAAYTHQADVVASSKLTCLVLPRGHSTLLQPKSIWRSDDTPETCSVLERVLQLDPIEVNLFRGFTLPDAPKFAQALAAASKTVDHLKLVHGLHSYFLFPGTLAVHRLRDGNSFATRRVDALQKGNVIFTLLASFQKEEKGFEHQEVTMPSVPSPDSLLSMEELREKRTTDPLLPSEYRNKVATKNFTPWPVDIRFCDPSNGTNQTKSPPSTKFWFKARGKLSDDQALHRPFRADEWLLYVIDSPSASNARGFCSARMFNQRGEKSLFERGIMTSKSDKSRHENGGLFSSNGASSVGIDETQQADLVAWLNDVVPNLGLPVEASDEQLRVCLTDGTVFRALLSKLSAELVEEVDISGLSYEPPLGIVKRFLAVISEMGLPKFELSDLEQGSMKKVLVSLWAFHSQFLNHHGDDGNSPSSLVKSGNQPRKRWKLTKMEAMEGIDSCGDQSPDGQNNLVLKEDKRKNFTESKSLRVLRNPMISEPSSALLHHVGHKFHEVFQLKQGGYADLPAAKISEMMKSNSLDNAPTQSLLSVVNGILDESIERKNAEIPHRVGCLLRKVVQEIERRLSTQSEHIRTQNNLYKAREEKYQSRIRALEAIVAGAGEETQIAMSRLQLVKDLKKNQETEKTKMEQKKELEEQDKVRLMKEKDHSDLEISMLKQQLDGTKRTYEQQQLHLETKARNAQEELEKKLKELECLLSDSRKKEKELEAFSVSKAQIWNRKKVSYLNSIDSQFQALQGLRAASMSIKHEVIKTQRSYSEEFNRLGLKLKDLAEAAENYHAVLEENRRLYNEVQDLKGNIRVYCRIRPFLPGQSKKHSTIEYIGDNGELVVANPSKQGKENHRLFKFNKVFGPAATQEEDQDLYFLSGPTSASKGDWGVNYRALSDLFQISQNRRSSMSYEVGVQMVEIYNEQVRDLLSSDASQKRYPFTELVVLLIFFISQPNGLAVPDASMHPVNSTGDVLELMHTGLTNRAVGATALNERSSRSHSVLTVHVRGADLETGAALRGNLHLVDLAGSERVDRSEVTGDRLKEAQHINKSLSALGDVIFALAQKSPHVPYRNSKLTQVLQSSLGGQAKTLMFVQLNPDVESFSETVSTLKFAERVSGVELGAARSNKEGRDVKELMEQVTSLKDTIAKKDEEIERLQLLKDPRTMSPSVNNEKRSSTSPKVGASSPRRHSLDGEFQPSRRLSSGKVSPLADKASSDPNNSSDDKHSEAGSQLSMDAMVDTNQISPPDEELLGFSGADSEERLSDISDGGLSVGTETDGSINGLSWQLNFLGHLKASAIDIDSPFFTEGSYKINWFEKTCLQLAVHPQRRLLQLQVDDGSDAEAASTRKAIFLS
ncbi:hypothetical protein Syun_013144 [Stephania yunnanensis]|uniref:Kinesin motor domain-containing protein n=1 Tax=Stephania yunnanensis TaxID=152371 RepID=A0AAP0K1J8_9MAGN